MSTLDPIEHLNAPTQKASAQKSGPALMQANALMLFAALLWGAGNVSQKQILDHLDPFAASGFTCLIGAVALTPLLRREVLRDLPTVHGSTMLLIQAALAFTVASTLMQIGYGHTTVTNAGFLVNTAGVMTPIMVWILYRQRPVIWIWPASLCSVLGVLMIGGGGQLTFALGDLILLASAFMYGIWTILVGRFVMRCGRPALLTVMQLFVCGCVCVVTGALLYGWPSGTALLSAWPELLFIGLISKGLAYALMAKGQEHVSPTCAAILVGAEAVFGAQGLSYHRSHHVI